MVTDRESTRRAWLTMALGTVGATAAATALSNPARQFSKGSPLAGQAPRIVSLSPGLTECVFALGAGELLVGVSDFCGFPGATAHLPRVGSAYTPNFEAIAKLAPTAILSQQGDGALASKLQRIAHTTVLPWLTLKEVSAGIAQLGQLTGHSSAARALSNRLRQQLATQPNQHAPRVLLSIYSPAQALSEVWFIRKNSLHGAALQAAGGSNAVTQAVLGPPRLSLEELMRLDPDVIILLSKNRIAEEMLAPWRKLQTLSAVRARRLSAPYAPWALSIGPRVLRLKTLLAQELQRLYWDARTG